MDIDVISTIVDLSLQGTEPHNSSPSTPMQGSVENAASSSNSTPCGTDTCHSGKHHLYDDSHNAQNWPWNNPESVISYATLVGVQQALCCYVHNVFLVVGVPVNVLSCMVFYRQGLHDRMNLCLFALALSDMLFVAFICSTGPVCAAGGLLAEPDAFWFLTLTYYKTGLYRLTMFSSGCLTTVIAVERCVCVCRPMKAAKLVRTRTMALIIVGIVVVLQLCCLVYPLKNDVSTIRDPATNYTYRALTDSPLFIRHPLVFNVGTNVINMSLIPFSTFVVVGVCTAVTVIKLRQAMAWRDNCSSSSSALTVRQVALVKMLVVVCLIYVLTSSASVAIGIARIVVTNFAVSGKYFNVYLLTSGVNFELSLLNSSVNFFVYVTQSSRFRMELWNFVCLGQRFIKASLGPSKRTIYALPSFPSRHANSR